MDNQFLYPHVSARVPVVIILAGSQRALSVKCNEKRKKKPDRARFFYFSTTVEENCLETAVFAAVNFASTPSVFRGRFRFGPESNRACGFRVYSRPPYKSITRYGFTPGLISCFGNLSNKLNVQVTCTVLRPGGSRRDNNVARWYLRNSPRKPSQNAR